MVLNESMKVHGLSATEALYTVDNNHQAVTEVFNHLNKELIISKNTPLMDVEVYHHSLSSQVTTLP